MGNNFVIFGDKRIKLSLIKKYEPINSGSRIGVKIFFAIGNKPQFEDILFNDEDQKYKALEKLD